MADAITIKALQDASLDAKSLEQVVNGDEAKQVTTRLGETYPSVKKAIKTMFENGGLPATPFTTKALMTASALVEGDYAVVTDDTVAANNGVYIKEGGTWILSKYNPSTLVEALVQGLVDKVGLTSSDNLFKLQYVEGILGRADINIDGSYAYFKKPFAAKPNTYTESTTVLIPVEGGVEYTLKVFNGKPTKNFRIFSYKEKPVMTYEPVIDGSVESPNVIYYDGATTSGNVSNLDGRMEVTFVTRPEDKYVIACFDTDKRITLKLTVLPSNNIERYIPPYYVTNTENPISYFGDPTNLFDGRYSDKVLFSIAGTLAYKESPDSVLCNLAVVPISPNKDYVIKTFSEHNRLRVVLADRYPINGDAWDVTSPSVLRVGNTTTDKVSFRALPDSRFALIYVSDIGQKPLLYVGEGEQFPETFLGYPNIPDRYTGKALLTEPSYNLFNGAVSSGLTIDLPSDADNEGGVTVDNNALGAYAVIGVLGNSIYSVKHHAENASSHAVDISLWDSYPTDESVGRLVHSSASFDGTLVITSSADKYMVVSSPLLRHSEKLQVEKGGAFSEYKSSLTLSPDVLPIATSQQGVSKGRKFIFSRNLDILYRRGRALDDYFSKPATTQVDDIYSRYDAIISKLPDGFMTKKLIGQDDLDNPIYEYETHPTIIYEVQGSQKWVDGASNNVAIKQPKIYINSGMHGGERSAVNGALYAIEDILLNPTDNEVLDFIRRNIKIIINPINNPSGYNAYTRTNHKGVDVNRDFPPLGPATQKESQALMQAMMAHKDIDFHIECHTGGIYPEILGYVLTGDEDLLYSIPNIYQELGREMQKEYPQLNQDPFNRWVYCAEPIDRTMYKFAQDVLGLRGVTLELCNNIAAITSTRHHEENVILYSEVIINTIITCLKELSHN